MENATVSKTDALPRLAGSSPASGTENLAQTKGEVQMLVCSFDAAKSRMINGQAQARNLGGHGSTVAGR